MYALMALLSILATGCFLRAYVLRDRRFVPAFGVALAAMLYTHNWALFFAAAARRRRSLPGLVGDARSGAR